MEFDRYRPIINIGVCPEHTWEEVRENVAWYKKCGYGGFAINGGYWMLYQFERVYCECGLLGPVKVTELKK